MNPDAMTFDDAYGDHPCADGPWAGRVPESVIVRLDDVHLSLGGRKILDGVSFDLERGETLCILGGSGTGKTTILRLILALETPDEGEIVIEGYPVTRCTREEVLQLRERIGMVFQAAALFDSLSVFHNVAFPLREFTDLTEEEIEERVYEVLEIVDLEPEQVWDQLPAELSGGMRKRVGIARAIAGRPNLILFDEPTGGLDPLTTRTINRLIKKLREELGVSAIVVTHDIRSAFTIAHRVALLYDGHIVFMGTPDEMMNSEDEYVRDFLGEPLTA